MIKVSHECPLCLLEDSRSWNDYDYALVHLFKENPIYYSFFEESLRQGRTVILDNSIFELGIAFDIDSFAEWVVKLRPTEYIIPDSLEDTKRTIDLMRSWDSEYKTLPGKKIGVIQGKTYQELKECYLEIDKYCDKIAISFDYSYYEEIFPHNNKFISWMNGRSLLINKLLQDKVINKQKPHHLLGIALPQEALLYKGYDFIESWDTSNPVVHALQNIIYDGYGLLKKESIKLVDLLNKPEGDIDFDILYYNIYKFKSFLV